MVRVSIAADDALLSIEFARVRPILMNLAVQTGRYTITADSSAATTGRGRALTEARVEPVRGEGWNIFQHRTDQELWCAVPPHRPIPNFLFSGHWVFSRHDIRSGNALPEFRDSIAEHAVLLQGFYLFHRFEAEVLKAASALESSGVLPGD